MEYPQGWQAKEGNRPHIVQKFVGNPGNGPAVLIVLTVTKIPFGALVSDQDLTQVLYDDPEGQLPEGSTMLWSQQTEYDGQPGLMLMSMQKAQRSGISLTMFSVNHYVVYKGRLILVMCSYGGADTVFVNIADPEQEMIYFSLLATLIGNSIILMDKW